jgi:SAM-dependent methyltransferase
MSLIYRIMYRVGFTPWDNEEVAAELVALGEQLPAGRALDIGCGTGTQAVYLARAGWDVVAVDAIEQPLRTARRRSQGAGVSVRWLQTDVAELDRLGLEPGFTLFYDRGCFHGLPDDTRAAYARAVTSLAAPGARLGMMAFVRNRRLGAPTGVDESEIRERFAPGWELATATDDSGPAPPGPMKDVGRRWYELVRK